MSFTLIVRKPTAQPLPDSERAARMASLGFGRVFTEHMVSIRWTSSAGWHDAQLVPYAPLTIDPANMALHYAQSIFEGLKAYRQLDGSIAVFRPTANAERFQASARRLAMPELPVELFVEAIETLVRQDQAWVPEGPDRSLYLRPIMFATESGLGVRPSSEYLFLALACPVESYFASGAKPVSVWLSQEYVRAAPGGTGAAKCAGNYAASLVAQAEAAEQGCSQVVWLDAVERRWVEEMGGMNLFFVHGTSKDATIVTPSLTGSLLPGVTRNALLQLAADHGYGVQERRISVEEWRRGNQDGSISEVFACGTAAIITPVGDVKSADGSWTIGDDETGPVTTALRQALLDVQTGAAPDVHGWLHPIVQPDLARDSAV